jgi:WD40 repeat protein
VWDVTDDGARELHALATGSGYPFQVQFSPDGSEMLVFTREGVMERIASATGEVLGTLTDQKMWLPSFFPEASQDWSRVATVSAADGRTVVRDLRTLEPVAELPPCASPLAMSADGSRLVVDGLGPCTTVNGPQTFDPTPQAVLRSRVVDAATGEVLLDLGERYISAARFNPGGRFPAGRYLAVNIGNKLVEIYDMDALTLLTNLDFGEGFTFGMAFDPEGTRLAGGTAHGHAWVLDLAAVVAGTPAADAMLFDQAVQKGVNVGHALSADGLLATAGLGDGRVKLWDVASRELLIELQTKPTDSSHPVEFSPDGSYLLYNDGGVLRRYPLDPDELVELAESRLTRDLTLEECRRYLGAGRCEDES